MQNMKLVNNTTTTTTSLIENEERYKHNLDQFNGTTNAKVMPIKAYNMLTSAASPVIPAPSNGLGSMNYRKCLSRVNLNLYHQNSPLMVHSSSQHNNKNEQSSANLLVTPKIIKINSTRGVKVSLKE